MGLPVIPMVLLAVVAAGMVAMLVLNTPVWLLSTVFVAICFLMIVLILIQRPRGGGLSGAFGGAGSSQAAFGSKAGDAATWATTCFFIAFISLAVKLTFATKPAEVVATPAQVSAPEDGATPAEAAAPGPTGAEEVLIPDDAEAPGDGEAVLPPEADIEQPPVAPSPEAVGPDAASPEPTPEAAEPEAIEPDVAEPEAESPQP